MTRLALLFALLLAACATPSAAPAPFFARLSQHCGKAYEGRLVSEDARDADWAGKRMVAHWARCETDRIAIALHVEDPAAPGGWNRSRTWLVRRDADAALFLHHDHRHADGVPDAVTLYGGTGDPARASRTTQAFPADAGSIDLFEAQGLTASTSNVWQLELTEDAFVYQLTRTNDATRRFRVRFDLTDPVPAPPPAWGWEADPAV